MFYLFAFCAVLAYALNSTLMAPFARQLGGLRATTLRGLSLGVTMLPLLAFVPRESLAHVTPAHGATLAALCAITLLANSLVFQSQKYLPVGISLALMMGVTTLFSTAYGLIAFKDAYSPVQWGLGALMLVEASLLGAFSRREGPRTHHPLLGVFLAATGGLAMGAAYSLTASLSKSGSPFLVAYAWEFGTGLAGAAVLLGMRLRRMPVQQTVSVPFYKVLLASSPTALATACYALATTTGPLGLASAILSTMGAFAALFSFLLYRERLTRAQGAMVLAMVATLVALKGMG